MNRAYIALLVSLLLPLLAHADSADTVYNRVHLSTSASEQVDNDTIVAVLYAQEQSHDAARASDTVNQRIAAAMQTARQNNKIKVQTLEYRTNPVYQSGKPTGQWQVQQAMRLESRDSAALSKLLGDLQKTLALRSLGYQLSEAARKEVETELTRRAIEAFKTRAQRITEIWGNTHFRLVEMHVSDNGGTQPRPMFQAAEMSLARTAPSIEAGEQQVTVTVQGTIELLE